jgi:hypothetical protein
MIYKYAKGLLPDLNLSSLQVCAPNYERKLVIGLAQDLGDREPDWNKFLSKKQNSWNTFSARLRERQKKSDFAFTCVF